MNAEEMKRQAGIKALDYIEDGMRLGLGTGSTAEQFVRALGEKVAQGMKVVGVPTSERTAALARELNIPLTTLDETPELDVTIDGADEFDADLRLVKGGGGALLREKIVATASKKMVVITDESKNVETLGAFPLPIEVIPFGSRVTALAIQKVAKAHGCEGELKRREDEFGEPFLTDSENFIYDGHYGKLPDADALATALNIIPGVVDNGLFIDIASVVIVGTPEGPYLVEKS
ncbi:MAG: ribose-5-phosphate isomerase RpiA [Parvibaculaceae bacterium]|nr:ribose-5-phosphate isomerase RpiA [Parvibaculaceae bacterium]